MLEELSSLLANCPKDSNKKTYQKAILEENVLQKPTGSAREKAYRFLNQLYGLNPGISLFGVLRLLWDQSEKARPLLAVLCSLGRDPLLMSTLDYVTAVPVGMRIAASDLTEVIEQKFQERLTEKTLASSGRNVSSTWSQSGHLTPGAVKIRQQVTPDPISTTYALFLGYLCGIRGEMLFASDWARVLDAPPHILHELVQQAAQQGWLEYRHSGAITEITFRYLLKGAG